MSDRLPNKLMVTKPLIPPMPELEKYLDAIWASGILTNRGKSLKMLETELCDYLGVRNLSLVSSGTLALALSLKALGLKGKIITTPFTHIATALAIYWNNLTPVFIDIDRSNLTLNPDQLKNSIEADTCAILPVHVFGNPCDAEKIHEIAQSNKLKLVYDAAHSFGVKLKGKSICIHGDMSVISFHATKVFSCIEGGAVVCRNEKTKRKIDALSNFGMNENSEPVGYGLNAKMNELQAAFGLATLKYVDEAIRKRKEAVSLYKKLFEAINGISCLAEQADVDYNYCYFPIIIDPEVFGASMEKILLFLQDHNIFPKRYFYPLITDSSLFKKYKTHKLPVSESISKNIICLPLSDKTQMVEITYIVRLFDKLYKINRVRTTHNRILRPDQIK